MSKILSIAKEPHKILRGKTRDVPLPDITAPKMQELISNMKETLKNTTDGVGLAAPQIAEPLRMFIISEEAEEIDKAEKIGWERRKKDDIEAGNEKPYEQREWKYYVFINPAVKNKSKLKLDGPEGCLSVPKIFGNVKRFEKMTVVAHDEHGKKFTRGASRFFARVMQHELDHLDGTLFIDKASNLVDVQKESKDRT